jgi:glycosyltransferase involved in cell wall biosynthesis
MLFSVMESLACGTPVLVSDAVDVADEIELFGGGVVFPNNDSDALAKALVEIISTPCVLARMRSEAQTVSLRYQNDSVAKALVSRFSSVCDSRC